MLARFVRGASVTPTFNSLDPGTLSELQPPIHDFF
jgi:hypothetical protein